MGGSNIMGNETSLPTMYQQFVVTVKFALNCQKVNRPMSGTFLINLINRLLV